MFLIFCPHPRPEVGHLLEICLIPDSHGHTLSPQSLIKRIKAPLDTEVMLHQPPQSTSMQVADDGLVISSFLSHNFIMSVSAGNPQDPAKPW